MNPPKALAIAIVLLLIVVSSPLFAFNPAEVNQDHPGALTEASNPDTTAIMDGVFAVPELQIIPSPAKESHLAFTAGEKVVDYDVSPAGMTVAAITTKPDGKALIKF